MTTNSGEQVQRALGEAVLGVSGVAFLRPALGSLLSSTARARRLLPGASPQGTAGIRMTAGAQGAGPAVEVHVVLLRGHRAVDVTRAIRQTVQAAHPSTAGAIPVHVTVTVTGIA
ncbi:Asp23/Gls24 family envelope stress response protein [Streptomyces sp. NPDC099050]|uniref:Asp23/Gls24 family envelope stress response protein n=1 Tax=Streptomyces sp. NPDC099050 TaxID=3366100 RepID=UPI00381E5C4E